MLLASIPDFLGLFPHQYQVGIDHQMLLDTCHIQDHLTGHMTATVVGSLGEIVDQKLYQLLSVPLHNCTYNTLLALIIIIIA